MATFKSFVRKQLSALQHRSYSRPRRKFSQDMSLSEAAEAYPSRNELHAYMHHYFHHLLPAELREHRSYFSVCGRGFGEDAFHAMWWTLVRQWRPRFCLEIGVYRGQVISLWATMARLLNLDMEVHGISPFQPIGDSVSRYRDDVDYMEDTYATFDHFRLSRPTLVRALSTDNVAVEHIASRQWDMIYIDGSHDYEIALADYRLCRERLKSGGILVLDDSSLYTDYQPPLFSFAGHPGPSRIVAETAMKEMRFLGAVGHNNIFGKR